ncbi:MULTISPECIES: helix-turn-helix domain-containing protein [Cytobacillus]|uniref:helix-turn-helix domain-containing protein n=1 Tax=Cytobacillus TaxID=2675230 RepID=UPI00254B6058|nr:helix-turn-helix transcriptional regulator [Cytobacillus oceanisediminis]MDK7669292.1 helix-turn-helix transcriptional regulator [Cytobacillus oceanisediminis]
MNGTKAKAIRCYLGESMEKFAKRIGVAASTISAIENNQREMSGLVRGKLIRIEAELPSSFFNFYEQFKK